MTNTTVYLIGAGPGDPELLTLKAKRLLEMADVVLYDYLAHPNAVMMAKNAEKICVGKKKGGNSMQQGDIHQLLLKYSEKVTHIVRLKGGDPMIFGRCGEEMAFLKKHHIPYEIVPGITSAIAAPTYAGIPITHRRVSQSVAFVTATREHDVQNMNIPSADTLIMMMSLLRLDTVVERLLETLPESTPIAIIESGTLSSEKRLIGTLQTIIKLQSQAQLKPPALLVIGKVVGLSNEFDWRNNLPLKNRRFVLFRAMHQQSEFRDMLYQLGAEVLTLPLNDIQPISNALEGINIQSLTHIIFTSENGVSAFFQALIDKGVDSRILSGKIIVAIGNHTNQCLGKYAISADIIPNLMNSDGIIAALADQVTITDHILIPTSSQSDSDIVEGLEEKVSSIQKVCVYKNNPMDTLSVGQYWIKENEELVFLNGASVKRFFEYEAHYGINISNYKIYSIGPKTTAMIQRYTKKKVIESNAPDLASLLTAIMN